MAVKIIKINNIYKIEISSNYGAIYCLGSFNTKKQAEKEKERIIKKGIDKK